MYRGLTSPRGLTGACAGCRGGPTNDGQLDDHRRRRGRLLDAQRRSRLGARGASGPRRWGHRPREPAPEPSLLRTADRLPARRRGVALPRRVPRHRQHALHRGVAPAGGARAVHRRPDDPRGEPVRRQSRHGRERCSRATGLLDHDRRLGRQHAAQRGEVGRPAAGGRRPRPELGQRRRRRLATRACRTTTTTSRTGYFYDPDQPQGRHAAWPRYPGLMDRAQRPFTATGLDAPSYVTFGNHDSLVQGNAMANAGYETIATGRAQADGAGAPRASSRRASSRPRPSRSSRSRPIRAASTSTTRSTAPCTRPARRPTRTASVTSSRPKRAASNGAADYYAFRPKDGLHASSRSTRCRRPESPARRPRGTSTTRSSAGSSARSLLPRRATT